MTIYRHKEVTNNKGELVSLSDYEGQALLIVNYGDRLRFYPTIQGLQALYDTYKAQGFTI